MTSVIGGVLVAYRAPIQRHVRIPHVQMSDPELISRYILRLHMQMYAAGVQPRFVNWAVVQESDLTGGVMGNGYRVKDSVLVECVRRDRLWKMMNNNT